MRIVDIGSQAMSPGESRIFKAGWDACCKHQEGLLLALESIRDHPVQVGGEYPEDDAFSMKEIAKNALSELAEHKVMK